MPGEAALARTRRFEELHQLNPDHGGSHLAVAGAALEAELWGEARHHLEQAAASRPSQQVYRMLAAVEERGEGAPDAVRDWLLKAASAPPDAAWLCDSCGAAAAEWSARCNACGGFDSLAWKTPAAPAALGEPAKAVETASGEPDGEPLALNGPPGPVDAARRQE